MMHVLPMKIILILLVGVIHMARGCEVMRRGFSKKAVIFHHDPGNDDAAMDIISKRSIKPDRAL